MDARTIAHFGRDVQARIRTFFDTPPGPDAPPIEIAQAVLDAIEQQILPVARGRRVLPYTTIVVRVLAPGEAAPRVSAAFSGFDARLAERLAEVGCEASPGLTLDVVTMAEAPASWADGRIFDIAYTAEPTTKSAATGAPADGATPGTASVHVTVLAGAVVEGPLSFHEATVSIGRSADPGDGSGRPRRNRLAFVDVADGISETVGRAHACLRRDPETGDYRLFDEGSRNGTSILRDGEVIAVHRRDPRGVRVRSGDEIRLGRAAIRITISRIDEESGPFERPDS